MKTGKTKNLLLGEEEDRWLGEMVRDAMRHRPSAPASTECPDPASIRSLAFHEKIDAPAAKAALLHLCECHRCARLAEDYIREYRERQEKNRQVN